MFKSSYLSVATLILLNVACYTATPNDSVNVTEARARLDKGSISLSGKFLYYLASTKPDENCVASATSLLIPLAQLALWATGALLEELLRLLNLKDKPEIKATFPQLTDEFENQKDVEFDEVTKFYANKNYPLSPNFISDSKQYFKADGENIDFKLNDEAAKIINEWVSNSTRGKIQDLVNADMFSENTRLCLVNAIYFLGNWVNQFNPNNTEVKDFHKSNGETVPMKIMYQQNTFNYAENDQYQVLEMKYKGENFSFVVVLPRNKEDLLPTLKSIEEPDAFNSMINSLSAKIVKVSLPIMLIETGIDIKDLLQKNNITKMFDPRNNGFEGILEVHEPVYVSDAVQKGYINVNELGTEAAVATVVVLSRMDIPPINPPKVFNANHPFIFYIKFRDMVLFCGTFVQ